ncbi:hypothetical protein FK004_16645 [Flavobacterium kingsejongi]|uniref:Uncharacterized protein n=1 Tax=Flavobacterium kingsejongi TaxID=1678728 RepID=A0A2S1LSK0_9FLAO|nr:hypothetical protein FK004_16645 [Flavobacterium kingsejongi]
MQCRLPKEILSFSISPDGRENPPFFREIWKDSGNRVNYCPDAMLLIEKTLQLSPKGSFESTKKLFN